MELSVYRFTSEIASERSWLFAVASNLVRDEARRDARERKRLEIIQSHAEAESATEPEPTSVERAEDRAFARQAIEMLAERDRDALLMREEGLGYEEIAEALDLSVGSVGTTLARARRRLRPGRGRWHTPRHRCLPPWRWATRRPPTPAPAPAAAREGWRQ